MHNTITAALKENNSDLLESEGIIRSYHQRARDELINRALKNFGTEHLPFKRFTANAFYYYMMCISFFLFEAYKKDNEQNIQVSWYAETFRRKLNDFAGQVIRSGRQIILKIPEVIDKTLNFDRLWAISGISPPLIALLNA